MQVSDVEWSGAAGWGFPWCCAPELHFVRMRNITGLGSWMKREWFSIAVQTQATSPTSELWMQGTQYQPRSPMLNLLVAVSKVQQQPRDATKDGTMQKHDQNVQHEEPVTRGKVELL